MGKDKFNTALIVKVVVPVVVVLLVGVVFLLKKQQDNSSATAVPTKASETVLPASSSFSTVPPTAESGDLLIIVPIDFDALQSSGLPVIIDFGADSCIPCKEMAPVLVELHKELAGKAIIGFVDVWKYRDLAQGIPIQVIPTQIFFDAQGKPYIPPEKSPVPFNMYNIKDTGEHVFTTHEGGLDKAQMLAILKDMGMQ